MAQAGQYRELFRFEAKGMPEDEFHVLGFRGREALSDLFSFDIDLVSKNFSVDLEALLFGTAKLTIKREGAPDALFAGRPSAARQLGHFNGYAYYSVTLRPAFWKFTQLVQSAIFLNKTAPEAVEELIASERFFPLKYEMRLTRNDYPVQEFAMQHEESYYDYITWRMEQQGAYFYFAPDGDSVIFSDSPQSHDAPAGTLYYSPATGLEGEHRSEVATSFSLCQTPLPSRVVVRSYNWKNPNLPLVGEAEVSPRGFGDVYLAHEQADTQAEAARIAEIRAEELACRGRIFTGVSSSPIVRPGALFTLERHYNEAFNRNYMVTEATHEGRQEAFISLALGIPLRGAPDHFFYHNEFKCIESHVPYRPERKAPRAKITGVMRAFVDGAGSGARAETDEYGRYKLVFPFDVSGRSGGNASCWIRMAQLNVGEDSGFAMPVQPGVEALVSFEEGDPDRPYISGVLANGETGSIYGAKQNISGLRTPGGNQITINDEDKKQGISMLMPNGTGITMSSGSSDIMLSTTDSNTSVATVAMNSLSGITSSKLTGFISSDSVSVISASNAKKTVKTILSFVPSAFTLSTKVMDSFKKSRVAQIEAKIADAGKEVAEWEGAQSKLKADKENLERKKRILESQDKWDTQAREDYENKKKELNSKQNELDEKKKALDAGKDDREERIQRYKEEKKKAETQAENLSWDADIVKLASSAFSLCYQIYKSSEKKNSYYGLNLAADKTGASSTMQAKASMAQLIASWLFMGGAKIAETGMDIDKGVNQKVADYDKQGEALYLGKDFKKVTKSEAKRAYTVSSAASLLPEITALIAMTVSSCKQAKKLGGILINAEDENVNITAATDVTAHADSSIVFHAGKIPEEMNAVQLSPSTMSDIRQLLYDQDQEGPTHWGAPKGDESHESAAKRVLNADDHFLIDVQHIGMDDMREQANHIASIADLIYDRAKNSVSVTDKDKVDFAGASQVARAGADGATTVLKPEQWLGYAPSNGTAKLGAMTGNYPAKPDAAADGEFSGIIAKKDKASLCYKDSSRVEVSDKLVGVSVQNGATLALDNDSFAGEAKTATLKSTAGPQYSVSADSSGVHIANFDITNGQIKCSAALTISGGIIKIG